MWIQFHNDLERVLNLIPGGKNAAVNEMKHIYSVWLNKKTFQCCSVPHSLIFLFKLCIKTEIECIPHNTRWRTWWWKKKVWEGRKNAFAFSHKYCVPQETLSKNTNVLLENKAIEFPLETLYVSCKTFPFSKLCFLIISFTKVELTVYYGNTNV